MKSSFYSKVVFVYALVIIALLAGCSATSSPKSAVQSYYQALEKLDTKALAKVTTPETAENLAPFASKAQGHVKELGKILTLTETIDGDTASVTVTFDSGEEEAISVKKVNGKWLVSEWD
jgi:uncharacterized lipoprotein